jgi:hypothetical protein
MGDEADADWDAGLIEAGIEDTRRAFIETPFTRQFKKDAQALRKRIAKRSPQETAND